MSIAIPINKAARVRLLNREHGLDAADIEELTGYPMSEIRAALEHGEARDKPKSRLVEARGPLTAGEVAEKLRVPQAWGKLAAG